MRGIQGGGITLFVWIAVGCDLVATTGLLLALTGCTMPRQYTWREPGGSVCVDRKGREAPTEWCVNHWKLVVECIPRPPVPCFTRQHYECRDELDLLVSDEACSGGRRPMDPSSLNYNPANGRWEFDKDGVKLPER